MQQIHPINDRSYTLTKNLHHILVAVETEREIDTLTLLKFVEQRVHTIQHVARTAAMQGGLVSLATMQKAGADIFTHLEDEAFGHTAHRRPSFSNGGVFGSSGLNEGEFAVVLKEPEIEIVLRDPDMTDAKKASIIMAVQAPMPNKQVEAYDSVAAYYENMFPTIPYTSARKPYGDYAKSMFDEWVATSLSRVASALGVSPEDLKRDIPFAEYKAQYRAIFGDDPVPGALGHAKRRHALLKVIREAKKLLNIENRVLDSLRKDREREEKEAERSAQKAEAQRKVTTGGQGADKRDMSYRDHAGNLLRWIKDHYGIQQCRELFQTKKGVEKFIDFLNMNTHDELLGHIERFETFIVTNEPTQGWIDGLADPLPSFMTVFPKFDPSKIFLRDGVSYFRSTTARYKVGGMYEFKATTVDKRQSYGFRGTVLDVLVPVAGVLDPSQRKNYYVLQASLGFMLTKDVEFTVAEDRLELA